MKRRMLMKRFKCKLLESKSISGGTIVIMTRKAIIFMKEKECGYWKSDHRRMDRNEIIVHTMAYLRAISTRMTWEEFQSHHFSTPSHAFERWIQRKRNKYQTSWWLGGMCECKWNIPRRIRMVMHQWLDSSRGGLKGDEKSIRERKGCTA